VVAEQQKFVSKLCTKAESQNGCFCTLISHARPCAPKSGVWAPRLGLQSTPTTTFQGFLAIVVVLNGF